METIFAVIKVYVWCQSFLKAPIEFSSSSCAGLFREHRPTEYIAPVVDWISLSMSSTMNWLWTIKLMSF